MFFVYVGITVVGAYLVCNQYLMRAAKMKTNSEKLVCCPLLAVPMSAAVARSGHANYEKSISTCVTKSACSTVRKSLQTTVCLATRQWYALQPSERHRFDWRWNQENLMFTTDNVGDVMVAGHGSGKMLPNGWVRLRRIWPWLPVLKVRTTCTLICAASIKTQLVRPVGTIPFLAARVCLTHCGSNKVFKPLNWMPKVSPLWLKTSTATWLLNCIGNPRSA